MLNMFDKQQERWFRILPLCLFAFLLCILLCAAPLHRLVPLPGLLGGLFIGSILPVLGAWLPESLFPDGAGLEQTANLEFLLLMAVAVSVYALSAWIIFRASSESSKRIIHRMIWPGALLAGLSFVLMPAMLSRDLLVYADYGHVLAAYGANPYFVSPYRVSRDIVTLMDSWNGSTSAYGPVWIYLCYLIASFCGLNVPMYFFSYRILGLLCHLLNIYLVKRILRQTGRSERVTMLGMFLYGWNPLVLLEACMGAHNDILVGTFLLLGVYFSFRTEQLSVSRYRSYLWPAIAFTLAALIKFTILPVLLLFLLFQFRRMIPDHEKMLRWQQYWSYFVPVLQVILSCLLLSLVLYLPLWWGHGFDVIAGSFSSPPSARFAENSLLRILVEWKKSAGIFDHDPWFTFFMALAAHSIWDNINAVAMVFCFLISAFYLWRNPQTQTLIQASFITLSVLLILTPWFYPWYMLWPFTLGIAMLARPLNRSGLAYLRYALVLSCTSFFSYLDSSLLPGGGVGSLTIRYCLVILLPLLVFLFWLSNFSLPQVTFSRSESIQSPE